MKFLFTIMICGISLGYGATYGLGLGMGGVYTIVHLYGDYTVPKKRVYPEGLMTDAQRAIANVQQAEYKEKVLPATPIGLSKKHNYLHACVKELAAQAQRLEEEQMLSIPMQLASNFQMPF